MPNDHPSHPGGSGAPLAERTRWDIVAVAVFAGIVCGAQIGKVPPALPILRDELQLGFITAGWVASLVNLCGALLGVAAGLAIDRVGARRFIAGSLAVLALGGAGGALAESSMAMLISRFLEGIGLVGTVVAAPTLIRAACRPGDRNLGLGIWGAYLPTGMVASLVVAPWVMAEIGWRGLWWVNVALAAGFTVLVLYWLSPRNWTPSSLEPAAGARRPSLLETLRRPGPWLFALCFLVYALMFYAVAIWLPSFLLEAKGWTLAEASLGGAAIVLMNILGNLLSAGLMHRGVDRWKLLVIAYLAYIIFAWFIFAAPAPDLFRLPAAMLLTLIGGMLPAACLAGGAAHARAPSEVATISGVVVQGSNTGSLIGAPVMAVAVTLLGGWDQGYWVMFLFGGIGMAVTVLMLRPVERPLRGQAPD